MTLTVLVTGGRSFLDAAVVYSALTNLHTAHGVALLVEGGARGADRLARQWAIDSGVPFRTFEADWVRHGKAAGSKRNGVMLSVSRPDIVVAFPGGTGTADMVRRALRAGVHVWPVGP